MKNFSHGYSLALAGLLALHPAASQAQGTVPPYPNKQIRIIVPFTAGGLIDTFTRTLAQHLSGKWGQAVVVENRPGATQAIGAETAAKAAPDGYTFFVGTQTSLVFNSITVKNLPYDPIKDFDPVSGLFVTPFYLVVNKNVPANSVAELIALAKSKPGKLTFASLGQGSSHHLAAEMLKKSAGIDILHVPYKGSAPASTDLIGGQVDMMFEGGASSLPHVAEGKLRALASSRATRTESMPNLPTVAETLPGYDMSVWIGLVAPKGTPSSIIDKVNKEVGVMLNMPSTHERFKTMDIEMMPTTPEEFGKRIRTERPQWTKAMREAGMEVNN